MDEVILKRFGVADEVREFEKGKFELLHIGGMAIGLATYEPGWRWSTHMTAGSSAMSLTYQFICWGLRIMRISRFRSSASGF